jgi:hypothetical protein
MLVIDTNVLIAAPIETLTSMNLVGEPSSGAIIVEALFQARRRLESRRSLALHSARLVKAGGIC